MKKCSVDGCGRPIKSKGLCGGHYARMKKYGDPLGGSTRKGEPMRFLREIVLTYDGTDCLRWPFARNNSGYATLNGKRLVSRVVCEEIYGPAPSAKHQAAHLCGMGHEGCVNKHHLSWKTPVENVSDKVTHGTAPRGEQAAQAKLTDEKVRAIRALRGVKAQKEIAAQFGVHCSLVSLIHRKKRWAHLDSV